MKLGRTCAAAALLGAAALPLAAPISWADAQPPVSAPQPPEARPAPVQPPTAEQPSARPAPPQQRPLPTERPRGQVSQRPVGAPETGGGPEESGINPVAVGGAAAAVIAAGAGAALVLRRRRANAN
ncbi:hypothetical protein [Saccharopolyspora sp. 5N708]|uniref:hypothetical protein n=1 Tax=Saccharopolyspora sp. 5N708 TaxID=3457424 RepID=UPI003FD54D48